MSAQLFLQPKLSRRRYAKYNMLGETEKSSDVRRTASLSEMGHEQWLKWKIRGEGTGYISFGPPTGGCWSRAFVWIWGVGTLELGGAGTAFRCVQWHEQRATTSSTVTDQRRKTFVVRKSSSWSRYRQIAACCRSEMTSIRLAEAEIK